MDMTIALKAFNEMQQTASMRLNSTHYDITVIYVTYFYLFYYLMQYIVTQWAAKRPPSCEVCRQCFSKTR